MGRIGREARQAARRLGLSSGEEKNAALLAAAATVRDRSAEILAANREDLADARTRGQTGAFLDRLTLDQDRLEGVAAAVESVAALPDPVGPGERDLRAAQRALDRAGRDAARRHRRDLRKPSERDRGCRGALPQGRQRGDSPRWLGELQDLARAGGRDAARLGGGRPAARRRSASCRPGTGQPSARCSPGSTETST